jgi:fermentation-respiration switch protein FrsA (DUF1100 family)
VDEPTAGALARGDRERVASLLAAPPPRLARLLAALSPLRVVGDIRARVILVHGRGDRAVPFTESLRLADALRGRSRLVLIGLVEHVETDRGVPSGAWRDVLSLWLAVYALLSGP